MLSGIEIPFFSNLLVLNWFPAKREISKAPSRASQQNPSGNQTILWLSHIPGNGNRPLSQLGKTSGARINPQILLRRPKFKELLPLGECQRGGLAFFTTGLFRMSNLQDAKERCTSFEGFRRKSEPR